MTSQERLIDRWRATVDPMYRDADLFARGRLRNTLIGDRLAAIVALGQLWHSIRRVGRDILRWLR